MYMYMKRFLCLLILPVLLFASGAVGSEQNTNNGPVSVAVLDIQSNSEADRQTGVELSNTIIVELAKLNKYKVLDKASRDNMLIAAGFNQYPCAFESCAAKAGKILRVKLILTGAILKIGDTYALNLGLLNSETGATENEAGKICAACETKDLFEFFVTSAFQLLKETPPLEIPVATSSGESVSENKFSDVWQTNWGVVELKQVGAKICGSYSYDFSGAAVDGKINNGTITGNRLDFQWEQSGQSGDGYFFVSEDGLALEGQWRNGFSGGWSGEWFGVRLDAFSESAPLPPETDLSGAWKTNFGALNIVQKKDSISGKYEGHGRIEGRIKGNRIEYKWYDSGKIGDAYFIVSGNGKGLLGKWRTGFSGPWKGDYIGIKKAEKIS